MNPFANSFEKKWSIVFFFMYALIMLPLPWYYSEEYIPSLWGTPLFIFGWIIHGLAVIILIFCWWQSCKNRPEYREFDDSESDIEKTDRK